LVEIFHKEANYLKIDLLKSKNSNSKLSSNLDKVVSPLNEENNLHNKNNITFTDNGSKTFFLIQNFRSFLWMFS